MHDKIWMGLGRTAEENHLNVGVPNEGFDVFIHQVSSMDVDLEKDRVLSPRKQLEYH